MLDFSKLIPQFDGITADIVRDDIGEAVERAAEVLSDAARHQDEFALKLTRSEQLTFWPLAMPLEPIDRIEQLRTFEGPYTIAATDGSQIMPSHHEVYSCYLINIGKVAIAYSQEAPVLLDSTPHLFHTSDDLYPVIDRRRFHVDEAFVGLERSMLELSTLRDIAFDAQRRDAPPVVALVDGSLIPWALNGMPESYQRQYIRRLTAINDSFAARKLPLVGYVSQSRSMDLINLLRVWQCPYGESDCNRFCSELSEDQFPCSSARPITDRQLYTSFLPRKCRGPLMLSGASKAVALPQQHHVAAAFVNVGSETARIEVPRWLSDDAKLLQTTLSILLSQSDKGNGYPIALAEAHNLAVVRTAERSKFFQLIANQLVSLGIERVRVSPKESGKRRGIV